MYVNTCIIFSAVNGLYLSHVGEELAGKENAAFVFIFPYITFKHFTD